MNRQRENIGWNTSNGRDARHWRRCSAALGWIVMLQIGLFLYIFHLACLDLNSHTNLYYRLWKSGHRRFEPQVAFGGLLHDIDYRRSLVGIPKEEFEGLFPNAFWELKELPPIAKPGEKWLVDDYFAANSLPGGAYGWVAIFKGGLLVELKFHKG